MPELLEAGLESQEGMVGTPSVFLGIVAHSCPFHPPSVNNQDRGIQIEDQAGSFVGSVEKPLAQQVVDSYDLSDLLGSEPFEKPSDRRLIWKAAESHNLLEGPILLQDLSFVDSLHPRDDGIEDSQKHFGWVIVAVARSGTADMPLKQTFEIQFLTKTVNQDHSGEVREVFFLEGNRDFSETFWHGTQMPPRGVFLSPSILSRYQA